MFYKLRIFLGFLLLLVVVSCTIRINEKMVLNDFTKKYDSVEINTKIKNDFNLTKNKDLKNEEILFSKKLMDKSTNNLFVDENINFERKYFQPNDSITLEYFEVIPKNPTKTIYFFIGNLDSIFEQYQNITKLSIATESKIFCLNYRGYGFSNGQLDIKSQIADNQKFYEYTKQNIIGKTIGVGYSLGSIYATQLSIQNNFEELVLLEAFSSTKDAFKFYKKQNTKGIKRFAYPFIKLTADDYLLNISNTNKLKNFVGRLLLVHSKDDNMLPYVMSENLFQNSISKNKKLIILENGQHNAPFVNGNWEKILLEIK